MRFSRTQKSTLSTTEEGYFAMADSLKDVIFARQALAFVSPEMDSEAVPLYEDNNGAIHLANNTMGSVKSMHIDISFHFFQGISTRGHIKIVHVDSKLQHADLLTENLGGGAFRSHRNYVMHLTLDY